MSNFTWQLVPGNPTKIAVHETTEERYQTSKQPDLFCCFTFSFVGCISRLTLVTAFSTKISISIAITDIVMENKLIGLAGIMYLLTSAGFHCPTLILSVSKEGWEGNLPPPNTPGIDTWADPTTAQLKIVSDSGNSQHLLSCTNPTLYSYLIKNVIKLSSTHDNSFSHNKKTRKVWSEQHMQKLEARLSILNLEIKLQTIKLC